MTPAAQQVVLTGLLVLGGLSVGTVLFAVAWGLSGLCRER